MELRLDVEPDVGITALPASLQNRLLAELPRAAGVAPADDPAPPVLVAAFLVKARGIRIPPARAGALDRQRATVIGVAELGRLYGVPLASVLSVVGSQHAPGTR